VKKKPASSSSSSSTDSDSDTASDTKKKRKKKKEKKKKRKHKKEKSNRYFTIRKQFYFRWEGHYLKVGVSLPEGVRLGVLTAQ
jgi:hypothetical protein